VKVLVDRNGLQARRHLKDNLRLSAFLTDLLKDSHLVGFSSGSTLTAEELADHDVLVITTRGQKQPYIEAEIRCILDFVHKGGGLLLMANHADRAKTDLRKSLSDTRKQDARLAGKFGITLERSCFEHQQRGKRTRIAASAMNGNHRIIAGASGDRPVRFLVINNCCSIVCSECDPLVLLPGEMYDWKNQRTAQEKQLFSCVLDSQAGLESVGEGRVVVTADSGFIGTDFTTSPGPGLIGHGHNSRFIKNAIRWLGGELQ
jgi:hypothetical protein